MAEQRTQVPPYRPTFADAMDASELEMKFCTYGDTYDLIATHFGSNSKVINTSNRIYDALKKTKTYRSSQNKGRGKWKDLPINPDTEKDLYAPLTSLINAVTALCPPEERAINIKWQDGHARTLYDDVVADTRPDIAAVVEGGDVWRGLHTLIQVKKPSDDFPAVLLLLCHVRQAFLEQPDRRFMFGMVFSMHNLTVWQFDRSGALGSEVFNIHEEPLKFITVIVGFLILKPEELGWDPTMKAYAEEMEDGGVKRRLAIPSYELNGDDVYGPSDGHERMWVISMPNPAAEPAVDRQVAVAHPAAPPAEEQFVTFQSIGVLRKQVLQGRSARMWKAWRMAEMGLPKALRKIYIIKDLWQDERRIPEGVFYDAVGPCGGIALLHSHGKVRIGDRTDCTLRLVRKSVKAQGHPLDIGTDQENAPDSDQQGNSHAASAPWSQDKFAALTSWKLPEHPLLNRVHTRLITASYGHPLNEFCSLQELLGALHDAIHGHQYLFRHGILHRDISTENVLITGLPYPNRGIIVGLENAVDLRDDNTSFDDGELLTHKSFMSYELLKGRPYFSGPAKRGPTSPWGTIPYVPEEPKKRTGPGNVEYDVVHDLEAFFWGLCWICMAHEGPGVIRTFKTDGLSWEAANYVCYVKNIFGATFKDGSMFNIANQKKVLMTDFGTFTADILDLLPPYFEPLRKLLEWLHGALHDAYLRRDFEGLHKTFMKYLHAAWQSPAVTGWESRHPAYDKMSKAATERRNKEDCELDASQPYIILKTPAAPADAGPSSKRSRAEEEVEAPVDEEAAPGPAKPKKAPAARKRQRTAAPVWDEQEGGDDEPVATDNVRSRTRTQAKKTAPAPTRRSTRLKNSTSKFKSS